MVFTLIGDPTMNNLVWVFFPWPESLHPTPVREPSSTPRKPLLQLVNKKDLTSRVYARASCAREKLRYGIVLETKTTPNWH
jgi:hypothetical protein